MPFRPGLGLQRLNEAMKTCRTSHYSQRGHLARRLTRRRFIRVADFKRSAYEAHTVSDRDARRDRGLLLRLHRGLSAVHGLAHRCVWKFLVVCDGRDLGDCASNPEVAWCRHADHRSCINRSVCTCPRGVQRSPAKAGAQARSAGEYGSGLLHCADHPRSALGFSRNPTHSRAQRAEPVSTANADIWPAG